MNAGLLDLPSPLLSMLDSWLGFLPAVVRILIWAAVAAALSMELYRLLSPQRRIAELRDEVREAQVTLNNFDGPFEEAWVHIRRMLVLALKRVGLVVPGTLIAALPVLFVLVWAEGRYGGTYPPEGQEVSVSVDGNYQGQWVSSEEPPAARISDDSGAEVATLPLTEPVGTLHKKRWWNVLVANPAGYVPADAPFDNVSIALPRQHFLPFGPDWIRGWQPIFIVSLFVFALGLKTARGIA